MYRELEGEPDPQSKIVTVCVSDDRSHKYQTSYRSDQNESGTKLEAADNGFQDDDSAPGTGGSSGNAQR